MAQSAQIGAMWIVILLYILIIIGVSVGLAFIPSSIAKKKGYSAGGFWAFGFFAFLPALIVALCIRDRNTPAAAPQVNTADELKKYADLLNAGAITQEEYDAVKARLL